MSAYTVRTLRTPPFMNTNPIERPRKGDHKMRRPSGSGPQKRFETRNLYFEVGSSVIRAQAREAEVGGG